ncbi:hypothetical protein B0T25DRAFT_536880 [Lasiosphaeria hispida]|uniref:Zn(2)-C6 fungal-type domain-containing protein n=1 Tax=Lasiosphaeria hispida TaxID=260671 RepID=A0AAJ0HKE0_9PEZI|nr:hypothetical protein B0T25DRAFT_536880 [Lasiosphaeria hispida]
MERQGLGHSAPYGQACMSCFKSKCKCIIRANGIGCHRLKKQCSPSDTLRRRAADKRQSSNTRIAELEGRLDGLVSLLQSRNVLDGDAMAQQQQRYPGVPPDSEAALAAQMPSSYGNASSDEAGDENISNVESNNTNGKEDEANTIRPPWATNSPQPKNAPDPHNSISLHESETSAFSDSAHLDTFRSRMLHHFPLIHLPPEVTAQQLQQSRPFLFRAIVSVVSLSSANCERAAELRRMFCEAVFLHQEQYSESWSRDADQTVDLLLGVLTYIAWGWDYMLNRLNPARLMTLAVSLVCEMHLDRPAPQDLHIMGLFNPCLERVYSDVRSNEQGYLELQRAVLACFVLSSAVSASLPQIHALPWTQRMEEGLAALTSNTECSSDAVLALQVRLQLIVLRSLPSGGLEHQPRQDEEEMNIKALLEQLLDLRASTFLGFREHQEILLAYTYWVELRVLQAIQPTKSTARALENAGGIGATSTKPSPNAGQLSRFWQALLAVEACTSALLGLPPNEFLAISFTQWAQITQCVVALSHLDALQDPGWDLHAVRSLVDLPSLLDHITAKFETASMETLSTAHQGSNVFADFAERSRVVCLGIQTSRVVPQTWLGEGELCDSSMYSNVGNGASTQENARFWRDDAPKRKYRFWMEQIFDGTN